MAMAIGKVFTKIEWANLTNHLGLSPKQAEIARQLLEGSSDKQIAQKLDIAIPTVRTYMGRMFVKLDVVGPVPEPATMGLLALGGLALLRRRKRM